VRRRHPDLILGRKEQVEGAALEENALRQRALEGAVDRFLCHAQRDRRLVRDLGGEFEAVVQERSRRKDAAHQPELPAPPAPLMRRPVSTMSIATDLPTARVSRCVPPAPGMMPRLISGWPNRRLGRDDQVAGHRQLAAAAETEAAHRGHTGLAMRCTASQ
jgi:hypothetical protein